MPLPADALAWKRRVHARLLADSDAARLSRLPRAALLDQVSLTAGRVLAEENAALTGRQRDALVQSVLFELAGLGPLEPLLEDETVSEIMVNGPAQVYVERGGRVSLTDIGFDDEAHLRRIIERILAPLGRRADESSPMVDGRLADGSQVSKGVFCHAINPIVRAEGPVSFWVAGPCVSGPAPPQGPKRRSASSRRAAKRA